MSDKYTYITEPYNGDPSQDRDKYIGGSDVGTIMGLNPYKSAYTLWAEKTGKLQVQDLSDKEAVWWGNYDEDGVAKRFTEKTGKKVRRSNLTYSLAEYPYLKGHVDRLIVGEKAGLECKTTSAYNKTDYDNGEIPPSHYAQCQFYMLVTGLPVWYYAVKRDNTGFYYLKVDRNNAFIETMLEAVKAFWKEVTTGTPPSIDGSNSTTDTIKDFYQGDEALEAITLDSETICILDDLDKCKGLIKDLTTEKNKYENQLKDYLKDNTIAISSDYKVTWKPQKGKPKLDEEALKQDHPDIYAKYLKDGKETRVLRITSNRKKEG